MTEIAHIVVTWRNDDGVRSVRAVRYEDALNDVAAKLENRCGTIRGIGPALREAFEELGPAAFPRKLHSSESEDR